MIRHYLNSAFRNLIKNKKFTAINVAGFAFAISVCLGIVTFLVKEYLFDKYHENSARIYRLTDTKNNSGIIDYRVKDRLLEHYSDGVIY